MRDLLLEKFIVDQVRNRITVTAAKSMKGLPTKRALNRAGIDYTWGGIYAFLDGSKVLYVGTAQRFSHRLTPQHHKIKSVAPAEDLRTVLVVCSGNSSDRIQAETDLIEALSPVFNNRPELFYLDWHQASPAIWAKAQLSTGKISGDFSWLRSDGTIRTEHRASMAAYLLDREHRGHLGFIAAKLCSMGIDYDIAAIATSILEDADPFYSAIPLSGTWAAFQTDAFFALFPQIDKKSIGETVVEEWAETKIMKFQQDESNA